MEAATQIPKLLQEIDRKVKGAPVDRALCGRVSIGVKRRAGGCCWWRVDLGANSATEWSEEFPTFDAALGLGELTAERLFAGQALVDEALCMKTGDLELLERFMDSYFGAPKGVGMLALRTTAQTGKAKKRRLRRKG